MPAPATSVGFAEAARRLADVCRCRGLVVPGFRSPPGHPTAVRTIRRRPDGTPIVAVRVRGRPLADVVADLVEGVIAANRLAGADAESARAGLLDALDALEEPPPARAA